MSVRKKLVIAFIIGFLMMGIGGGISFAEFSSFRYGGEKILNGEMSTVNLQQTVPEDADEIVIRTYGYDSRRVRIVEDSSMAAGEILVEVTCDADAVEPIIEELEDYVYNEGPEEISDEPETALQKTKKVVYALNYYYSNDDLTEFFKMKDEFMECIKNRVIYSYSYNEIQGVLIKVPLGLSERITLR